MNHTEKQVIDTFKYISNMKQQFLLSEIQNFINENLAVLEIYNIIRPLLSDLNLQCIEQNGDFRINHIPSAIPIILTPEQQQKLDMFFKYPVVSAQLQVIIEQYINKKTGKQWDDTIVLERIRKAIIGQKSKYWKEGEKRKISYEKGYSVIAYLAYQFPVYFIQFQHLLYELVQAGILKNHMKILDMGTGAGTVPLAIINFYKKLDAYQADIHTVELYEENIEAYNSLVPAYAPNYVKINKPIKTNIKNISTTDIPHDIDLIVFSNVLNEIKSLTLEDKADIVKKIAFSLADDGSIIIIEPADKLNSISMRKLSILLRNRGLEIYAPCSFIRGICCTLQECWSFEQKPDINPPLLMHMLADCKEPYKYINTDIKYSYGILRKDKLTKQCYRVPKKSKFALISHINKHKGKRINVIGALMSHDLGDSKYSLFRICDGTSKKSVYAVIPIHNVTDDNVLLKQAKYGEILELYNVLVNYNEDKDGYNLLLSRSSTVSRVDEDNCLEEKLIVSKMDIMEDI